MSDITDIENVILKLPDDQRRAVATVLTLIADRTEAARDAAHDDPSARWTGLSEAHHIVGSVAAYARGVARQ